MLTFGSLFAGIGGFDLGLERAGMVPAWQVEIDGRCRDVLAHHWPDVERFEDVRDVGKRNLRAVDLVCGGFPCQDLSVAGRREGLDGKRSGLWFEFLRVIEELKPGWVIVENVPGLLSSNERRDFAVILSGLGECGYGWAYRVLDAQYWGVPQRRRRVFVVGCLGDWAGAAEVLFERDGSPWDSTPSRETRARIASPIKAGTPSHRNGGSWPVAGEFVTSYKKRGGFGVSEYEGVTGTLESEGGTHQGGPERLPMVISETGQGFFNDGIAPLRAEGENRPSRPSTIVFEMSQANQGVVDKSYIYAFQSTRDGKDANDEIVPTRKVGTGLDIPSPPAIAYAGLVRRLTPLECERLQGFPDIEKCVIIDVCLDQQKNYASVEIESHKLQRPVGNVERTESLELVKSVARNLNTKNQLINEPAHPLVHINCGERTVDAHNRERLLWSANIAESENKSPLPISIADFAHLLVGLVSTAERIITGGVEESQVSELSLTHLLSGEQHAKLFGKEITQLAKDAMTDLTTHRKLLKSIISGHLNTLNIEQRLTILCSYVLTVITGYILPEITNANSFKVKLVTRQGWTSVNGMADGPRYKMLGNAVAVPVIEWIGRRIMEVESATEPAPAARPAP